MVDSLGSLELEFRMAVSLHVGAVDQTWVRCKAW